MAKKSYSLLRTMGLFAAAAIVTFLVLTVVVLSIELHLSIGELLGRIWPQLLLIGAIMAVGLGLIIARI
jgi:hypothetical protein